MYIFCWFFFIEINVLSFLKWTVDAWYNWGHRKRLNQVTISRRNGYFHFHVHCRIIHNSKDMEQCKSPSMGELKKGWHFIYLLHTYYAYTHTHVCVCTGISFSHKRRNPAICDNMDNLGLLDTHRLVGSVSCGVTALFSWVLVHTRFCLCPPRVCFPVLGKFWWLYVGVNGDLLQEGLCHTQVCCTQSPCPWGRPLLTHTSSADTQTQFCLSLCGVSGSSCAQGLFVPSKRLWWVWGLIINTIVPLLLSF